MTATVTPVLDPRSAQNFYAGLAALQPAFVPELAVAPSGQTTALMQITARFSAIVAQRLVQAPDRDKLAFLDMLGVTLIPAQPARAPLVFTPLPLSNDSRIPAGTRAGASSPGVSVPTTFETENDIGMTAATLTQVVSLWPDQDGFVDHSQHFAGGQPFTLFQNPSPVEHVLYLAHRTLFAFKGQSTVEARFALAVPGSKPLTYAWEFWDGHVWRPFIDFDAAEANPSQDGTVGLTRSGVITLEAGCGDSEATSVANISNYWIRGRLTAPLPPDPTRISAVVNQISLRTTIDRGLVSGSGSGCQGVAQIDAAFAGSTMLDLTKTFFPLGKAPGTDAAFYFASQEVFSKPGAKVTLCFDIATTPEQQADALGGKYAAQVGQAEKDLLAAVKEVAEAAIAGAYSATSLGTASGTDTTNTQNAATALQNAVNGLTDLSAVANVKTSFDALVQALNQTIQDSLNALAILVKQAGSGGNLTISTSVGGDDAWLTNIQEEFSSLSEAFATLSGMTAISAAAAGGASPPLLAPPRLVWEYWNGAEWRNLVGPKNDDTTNLLASGEISFTAPQDISPFSLNGSAALFMRARLASGSYNTLTLVTWKDPSSGQTNWMPVIQPRPPSLGAIAIGYVYRSPWLAPEQSLSWNDFVVENHTPAPSSPAANYAPYHPVADTLPSLYLGFNQPSPNDYLSIYFDIAETEIDGPPLVWEAWSAGSWQTLTVSDDTGALARAGMVAFLHPGSPPRATVNVAAAAGSTVTATSALAAAVFKAGDEIVVQPDQAAEVGAIESIDGARINLVTPLSGSYANTTATLAALPRFGISLDWVRARLKTDGAPEQSRIKGIYPNAVWARQVQTVNNETLGSGTGQPSQWLRFQQFPVLEGEVVQVRELDGAQANVGFPALTEQLTEAGIPDSAIRTVTDARSGLITEVWVTWFGQPNFYFSGPDDRHYVLNRATGRIIFGDGVNGMLPTAGNSNIVSYLYQAGGGLAGDVAAGAINQLLSGASARSVTNPAAAEGGADTEPAANVSWRGPQVLRHRGAALAAADYESLALQASPGVAIARCLPATDANLRPAPGWVTLIVVPRSLDPEPAPSYELKQEVLAYIAARAPAAVEAGRISIIAPNYLAVGVSATVAARTISQSGVVKAAVVSALSQFLHPVYGGPSGRGWPFGRNVFLSDVASLLEGVDGVDYVQGLELLLDLIPSGDAVTVPPERLVAAGPMSIAMEGAPNA